MKKIVAVINILAFCSFTYAQGNYFRYKTVHYKNQEFYSHDFSFPIFSKSNKFVAKKINQTLQITELNILKGFETNNIFEEVSIDDGTIYGGKLEITFTIQNNSNRLLSVKFAESSCGATCHYWVDYYNFNSGNGDIIQLKDLFTENGYKTFFNFVTKRRIAHLKKELTKKIKADEREYFYDIIGCYERDDLIDYYIKNNTLYIDGENCFSKNQKFSGIKTISRFRLKEFKNYLNGYGKSLFSITKNSIRKYRSNILPQLFYGTIAQQDVLLVLNTGYEKEIRAEYVDLRYGKGIFLQGELNGTELTLIEKIAKKDNGFIKAKFDGQNIVGTWISKDKTITHELRLTRK